MAVTNDSPREELLEEIISLKREIASLQSAANRTQDADRMLLLFAMIHLHGVVLTPDEVTTLEHDAEHYFAAFYGPVPIPDLRV